MCEGWKTTDFFAWSLFWHQQRLCRRRIRSSTPSASDLRLASFPSSSAPALVDFELLWRPQNVSFQSPLVTKLVESI